MSFTFSPEQSELVTNPIKLRPYVDTLAVTFGHPARVVAILGIGSFAKGEAVFSKVK